MPLCLPLPGALDFFPTSKTQLRCRLLQAALLGLPGSTQPPTAPNVGTPGALSTSRSTEHIPSICSSLYRVRPWGDAEIDRTHCAPDAGAEEAESAVGKALPAGKGEGHMPLCDTQCVCSRPPVEWLSVNRLPRWSLMGKECINKPPSPPLSLSLPSLYPSLYPTLPE